VSVHQFHLDEPAVFHESRYRYTPVAFAGSVAAYEAQRPPNLVPAPEYPPGNSKQIRFADSLVSTTVDTCRNTPAQWLYQNPANLDPLDLLARRACLAWMQNVDKSPDLLPQLLPRFHRARPQQSLAQKTSALLLPAVARDVFLFQADAGFWPHGCAVSLQY